MKNLMMTAMITALTATTATAEGIKPQPQPIKPPVIEEQPQDSSSGPDGFVAILIGAVTIAVLANTVRNQAELNERRPLVQPQTCMNKVGGVDMIVACDD